ncbi:MAG: hypothetical protein AAFN79_21455 [Pseudomonadota bacterium]
MRVLIATLIALFLAAPVSAFESRVLRIQHDGLDRRALMDARADVRGAPVLIVLHGGIAGPETVRRRARVGLAREGWIVLWPYAVDDWNDGRTRRSGTPYDDADDVGFMRALVADLARRGMADPDRVFVAGPSLGGTMALRLLCDAPDFIAGAAVAIASLPQGKDCPPGPPRPILYIHGTDDGIMPPDGGRIGGSSIFIRDRGRVTSVDETLAILARRNGCAGFAESRVPDRAPGDGSTVRLRDYRGCAEPLRHFIIDGGGHTWPGSGSSSVGRSFIGATNQDISATREVEAFFKRIAAE